MRGHGASYKMGGVVAMVAGIVGQRWGVAAAASLVVGAAVNYPFLIGRVEILPFVDMGYLVQAAAAASIPVLYFYYPLGAPMYIPLVCTALVLAMLKQLWDQAVLVRQLSKQNNGFAQLEREFGEAAQQLEVAMASCLGQSEQMDSLIKTHKVMGSMNERLSALNLKVLGLVNICENSKTAKTVMDRLTTVAQLSRNCETKQQELERLNREISGSKEELKKIIESLSGEQCQLKDVLVQLQARLAQLAGAKSL